MIPSKESTNDNAVKMIHFKDTLKIESNQKLVKANLKKYKL